MPLANRCPAARRGPPRQSRRPQEVHHPKRSRGLPSHKAGGDQFSGMLTTVARSGRGAKRLSPTAVQDLQKDVERGSAERLKDLPDIARGTAELRQTLKTVICCGRATPEPNWLKFLGDVD
jgi:hypothetical protein